MAKIGIFQMLGAAISTIGIMFLIVFGMSYTGLLPIEKLGMDTAIVSFLMATNGYMILLFGVISSKANAPKMGNAIPSFKFNLKGLNTYIQSLETKET